MTDCTGGSAAANQRSYAMTPAAQIVPATRTSCECRRPNPSIEFAASSSQRTVTIDAHTTEMTAKPIAMPADAIAKCGDCERDRDEVPGSIFEGESGCDDDAQHEDCGDQQVVAESGAAFGPHACPRAKLPSAPRATPLELRIPTGIMTKKSAKGGGHLPHLFTIATLGSHSALQILKGAKDEGFHTLAVVTPQNERLYASFSFVDEVIVIPRYSDFPALEPELNKRKVILVPHGSFVAYLSLREHKAMKTPYFGNKAVLDWEADRLRQRDWLLRAGLKMPRQFTKPSDIDRPVIVKLYGAQGGKGYLFVKNADDFKVRASHLF